MQLVITIIFAVLLSGCSKQEAPKELHQTVNGSPGKNIDSTLIRNKNTDVSLIDKNKDNQVFQCPMDYNVISDDPGLCIKCRMKLRETNISAAQKNLNNFYND
jgi:PBP1b-binding outer membrane lipoprotein LpoB